MSIKLVCFNAKGLRGQSKAAFLLCDLLSFGVDMGVTEMPNFVCNVDACVLSNDFVYSAYGNRQARGISLLVKRNLGTRVDLIHVDAGGRLIVVDIAVKRS